MGCQESMSLQRYLLSLCDEAKGISAVTSPVHHTTNRGLQEHMNPVKLHQSS